MALSLGVSEGRVTREDTLRHCRAIVAATPLPVSADLEKGFGDSQDSVAETIRPRVRENYAVVLERIGRNAEAAAIRRQSEQARVASRQVPVEVANT